MDPVRTAFLVILEEGVDFDQAAERLARFAPEVSDKIQGDAALNGTVDPAKLEQFMPHHMALGMDFIAENVPNIRGPGMHRNAITRAQSDVLGKIEAFRKRIAASANYLDDQSSRETHGPALPLYEAIHLPSENDAVYRRYL